jgi:hypothetical protein
MRSDRFRKAPKKEIATSNAAAYLDLMPGKPFQSKLIPYEDLIRDLRKAGRTYREISDILKKDHGIEAHPDTVNSFVIVRARGAKVYTLPDPAPSTPQTVTKPARSPAKASGTPPGDSTQSATDTPRDGGFFESPPPEQPQGKGKRYNLGF